MNIDQEIQRKVMEELRWHPYFGTSEIGVAVVNGIVTLSGTVDSYSKKVSAENAAKHISGVKAVVEKIDVRFSHSESKTDSEIAEMILSALKWNTLIRDQKILVTVEKGWVTLEGDVEWQFQRDAVSESLRDLVGISGVINNIEVKAVLEAKEIRDKIMAAIHRSATIDSRYIEVISNGSAVTLNGKVRSAAEKRDAEKAVWFAPGVCRVDNRLEIDPEIIPG